MTKSARTAWAPASQGGSLKLFWLLSAAVHAGLLGGLALLPSGDGWEPRPGYPVRLVRLAPPEESAPPVEESKLSLREAVPPLPAPVPRKETAAPAPKPQAPKPAGPQPEKKKEAAPSPPREIPAAPPQPKTEDPAPAPPRREAILPAPPLPAAPAQAPPRPAPQTPSALPRAASLPPPPADPALSSETLRERLGQIVARIERAKRYPEQARLMGVEGTAVVAFRILPDGKVGELAIRETSGHPSLDAATLEAVRRAQPFPYVRQALVLPVRYTLRDTER